MIFQILWRRGGNRVFNRGVRIDILTLFPKICEGPLGESMMRRARERGLAQIAAHNIRDWATGKHHVTDESPYGGGQGMVMKAEPIFAAVEALKAQAAAEFANRERGTENRENEDGNLNAETQSFAEERGVFLKGSENDFEKTDSEIGFANSEVETRPLPKPIVNNDLSVRNETKFANFANDDLSKNLHSSAQSADVPESVNGDLSPSFQTRVVFMSPAGRRFDQKLAAEFATSPARAQHLILICGHYEGIDQRVIEHLVDDEISIGDYVLTNGALAAAVFVDAVVRLIPGVLGDAASAADDSFANGQLEFPQFTRPVEFRGWRVPEILLSGNHAAIAKWRAEQALAKTQKVRPDLLR